MRTVPIASSPTERPQMSYDILRNSGEKSFKCNNWAWPKYLTVGTAFGWAPAGALHRFVWGEESVLVEHPSGSYFGNDHQRVTDDDACALGASLNLAIATVNAGLAMTDDQVAALKEFEITSDDPYKDFDPKVRAAMAKLIEQCRAEYPPVVRTIQTPQGSFDVNIRGIMDLAEVVSAGGFTVA